MKCRIKILVRNQWDFNYDIDDRDVLLEKGLECIYCDSELDSVYSYIINKLDEAGLLPLYYEPVCCYCYVLEKFGLLDFADDLEGFIYDKESDVLKVMLTASIVEKNILLNFFDLEIRIHEYSKWG